MNSKDAIEYPTTINRVHESCYRSYQTLLVVQTMLDRKDSHETIRAVIDTIYEFPPQEKTL